MNKIKNEELRKLLNKAAGREIKSFIKIGESARVFSSGGGSNNNLIVERYKAKPIGECQRNKKSSLEKLADKFKNIDIKLTPKQLYAERLQDPKWKHFRETILTRDGFKCTHCDNKKLLQVHHLYYKSGNMPWEYPESALITLCKSCHEKEHGIESQ